jgi:tetraacyldisaccharide 4'-kinase
MREKVFFFFEKIMRGEGPSFCFAPLRALLYLLSLGYKLTLICRDLAYRFGLCGQSAPLPVISIGNLAVGGRSKTPFTLFLTEAFLQNQKRVAIATRGYLSQVEKKGLNLLLPTDLANWTYQAVGDEALLLKRRAKEALVIVGKDRLSSAHLAHSSGAELLILDDGFQYRRLLAYKQILMLSPSDLAPQTHFLPRGFLRDLPKRVQEADLVVVDEKDLPWALKNFAKEKIVAFQNTFTSFKDLEGQALIESLKGKVGLFCALGAPERFLKSLALLAPGLEVVLKALFLDHQAFLPAFLYDFALQAQAQGAEALLCTEKDIVKLPNNLKLPLPLYYPELKLKLVFGAANLEKTLNINLPSAMIEEKAGLTNGKRNFTAQAR